MPRPFARNMPSDVADLQPLAVMDGTCTLCSFGARMIHRLDRSGDIRILPIQTPLGRQVLQYYRLDVDDPSTWLFLADGRVWSDFDAMVELGRRTGGLGQMLNGLMLLPRSLRGALYRLIARNRYALFGRKEMCAIADPEFQARLVV